MKCYRICLIGLAAIVLVACRPSIAPYASYPLTSVHAPPSRVVAQFLGTTTLLFGDGTTSIMSDGFFTRPSIWQMLTDKIAPDDARIESALSKAGITHVDAIFVAHSHHDHAMDTARVALRTGAMVYGSKSTGNIVLGDKLPPQHFTQFEDGQAYVIGDFNVNVFETPHSPGVVFPGTIHEPIPPPMGVSDYREGGNYSFLIRRGKTSILLVASGNFIPGRLKGVKADTVFLGIGGLGKQSDKFFTDYWREVVQAVGGKTVIPVHWDDFTRTLEEPIAPMPYLLDDFDHSMTMLSALAQKDGVQIRLPVPFVRFEVE